MISPVRVANVGRDEGVRVERDGCERGILGRAEGRIAAATFSVAS
jgi:hypothetical protein